MNSPPNFTKTLKPPGGNNNNAKFELKIQMFS